LAPDTPGERELSILLRPLLGLSVMATASAAKVDFHIERDLR